MIDFKLLRIDEAILPFMNGDAITDIAEQFSDAVAVEFVKDNIVYQQTIPNSATWLKIFRAFDQVLLKSNETEQLDLAGVVKKGKIIKPIWLK